MIEKNILEGSTALFCSFCSPLGFSYNHIYPIRTPQLLRIPMRIDSEAIAETVP